MAICHFHPVSLPVHQTDPDGDGNTVETPWLSATDPRPPRPPRSPEALAVGVVVAAAAQRPTAWKAAAPGRLELEDLTGESLLMVK